jgi:hypothetical protein
VRGHAEGVVKGCHCSFDLAVIGLADDRNMQKTALP